MTPRYCMVAGGPGAFIGAVHRKATALDGAMELVAGAVSSDPDKSAAQGRGLNLPEERGYGSFQEMVEGEAVLPADERIQGGAVVTPNASHLPNARGFCSFLQV